MKTTVTLACKTLEIRLSPKGAQIFFLSFDPGIPDYQQSRDDPAQ